MNAIISILPRLDRLFGLCLLVICSTSLMRGQVVDQLIFYDDFETGAFDPAWTSRPNLSGTSGQVQVLAGEGIGGSFGLQLVRSNSGSDITENGADLELDLSAYVNKEVFLTFDIRDYYDETHLGDALLLSDNGGTTFKRVLAFHPGTWCNQYGQLPPIPIHLLAAREGLVLSSQFVIRFQQAGFQGANTDGIYLDNVKVYVPVSEYKIITSTSPFFEDFETGRLEGYWAHPFADSTTIVVANSLITQPSNLAHVVPGEGLEGSFGLQMGKACADGYAVNAVDLRLNLLNAPRAMLSFWIRDYYEETHIDDAIYFSDNGGISFEKVFSFDPQEWCNQFGQFPPIPIHKLAQAYGLDMTDQFIIRFQQGGESATNTDGLYLDDISVYVPEVEYASLPYSEDFETGSFSSNMAWSFADETTILTSGGPITRPSNWVAVFPNAGTSNSMAAGLTQRCAAGPVTNALDIFLNLENQTNVFLNFEAREYYEETHIDDVILLSNNGGVDFKRIYSFDWTNTSVNQWNPYPLDLSALASQEGIAFTDSMVIRFQQHGSQASNSDGIYLDNIQVVGSVGSTGIATRDIAEMRLYPNPAQAEVELTLPIELRSPVLWISDMNGREVNLSSWSIQGKKVRLNVGELPVGFYSVMIEASGIYFQGRFAKQ